MFIANHLREKNIAEFLIYMWQVEDLIRANSCSMDRIKANVVAQYKISEEDQTKLLVWYQELIDMMRLESVMEKGHLQVNKNVISTLTDLHAELLASTKEPFYGAAYFKALPYIVELRQRSGKSDDSELDTCFEALYGMMLLKLQQKEISPETTQAMEQISKFISLLANYYEKDKKGELDLV